jgi:hypothetical protein
LVNSSAGDAEADQADALGLAAVDGIGGQQVELRLGHAAQQRPDHGGVVAGRHPEGHVGVDQPGVLGGDGDVGQEGHTQTTAGGRAVDGGDDRLVELDHAVHDVPPLGQHPLQQVERLLLGDGGNGP